jgi:hypothetical protein
MKSRYPYTNRISGYVSKPNPKVHYPGNTRIRPGYKNYLNPYLKNRYFYYPYPVTDRYTGSFFTPIQDPPARVRMTYMEVRDPPAGVQSHGSSL